MTKNKNTLNKNTMNKNTGNKNAGNKHILNKNMLDQLVDGAWHALIHQQSMSTSQKIAPEKIEALYALGFSHYAQNHFAKAEEIFSFAYRLDSRNIKLLEGLAASYKMQGKFQEALHAYAASGLIDMANPSHSFHAAECFFALKDYSSCQKALDASLGLIEGNPDHHQMKKQIKKMKAHLEEQHAYV